MKRNLLKPKAKGIRKTKEEPLEDLKPVNSKTNNPLNHHQKMPTKNQKFLLL